MRRSAFGFAIGAAVLAGAGVAHASTGIDSPEGDIEQMGRGSAWIARADTPLAAYYNPAALAFQSSGLYVGLDVMFRKTCFTRENPDGSAYAAAPGAPPYDGGPNDPPAAVCAQTGAFPAPNLGAVWRINKQWGIGLALLGPHAYGKNVWPESVSFNGALGQQTEPSPNRYLLTDSSALELYPTLGVGFAPLENVSFGAAFIWGIATADFTNFAEALSPMQATKYPVDDFANHSDLKAELKFHDYFIPGFVLSGMWAPAKTLDVSGMYKWMDDIHSSQADVKVLSRYWNGDGTPNQTPCGPGEPKDCNLTVLQKVGNVSIANPMEARIGTRFHWPRKDAVVPNWANPDKNGGKPVHDPMSQDVFDVEVDFTWAHDSQVDALHLAFPANVTVNGTPGVLPTEPDIPHNWKDVFGARLGGDVVVIPNLLALRAGGWVETKGQDDAHLLLDFDNSNKAGIAGGASVRFGMIDVHAAYQHTFWGTLDNGGQGAVHAISGDASAGGYSQQAVNGGKLTSQMDEFGFAAAAHF